MHKRYANCTKAFFTPVTSTAGPRTNSLKQQCGIMNSIVKTHLKQPRCVFADVVDVWYKSQEIEFVLPTDKECQSIDDLVMRKGL